MKAIIPGKAQSSASTELVPGDSPLNFPCFPCCSHRSSLLLWLFPCPGAHFCPRVWQHRPSLPPGSSEQLGGLPRCPTTSLNSSGPDPLYKVLVASTLWPQPLLIHVCADVSLICFFPVPEERDFFCLVHSCQTPRAMPSTKQILYSLVV